MYEIELDGIRRTALDSSFEDDLTVLARLTALEEKVIELERFVSDTKTQRANNTRMNEIESIFERQPTSFLTAVPSGGKCGGCYKFAKLFAADRLARLQCLWLVIIVIGFVWFGTSELVSAMQSENSKWKPQRLKWLKDYSKEEDGAYEMPYFYFNFWMTELKQNQSNCTADDLYNCSVYRGWTHEEMKDTWSEMWAVQPNFACDEDCQGPVTIDDQNNETFFIECDLWASQGSSYALEIEELVFGVSHDTTYQEMQNQFVGWLRFKPTNPLPGDEWTCSLSFNHVLITNGAMELLWFDFVPSRDTKPTIVYDSEAQYLTLGQSLNHMDYSEEVLYIYRRNSLFQTSLTESFIFTVGYQGGMNYGGDFTTVDFSHNPVIEYWEEYVEKSYFDWFASMGGQLSLMSIAFFWVSAWMTYAFSTHEWDMGILSIMSFVFSNRELMLWMKAELVTGDVLMSPERKKTTLRDIE